MVNPSEIGEMFNGAGMDWLGPMMNWLGILLVSGLILTACYFLVLFLMYNKAIIKVDVGESGEGDTKSYFIKGMKLMRGRLQKVKGVERLTFLFSKQHTEPPSDIHSFNWNGMLLKSVSFVYGMGNDIFLPQKLNFAISDNPGAHLNFQTLPYNVRRSMALELQEIAKEFEEPGFMAKYGNMLVTFGTVMFCCILAGVVIWMTYKYIGTELAGATAAAKSLGETLREGVTQRFGG